METTTNIAVVTEEIAPDTSVVTEEIAPGTSIVTEEIAPDTSVVTEEIPTNAPAEVKETAKNANGPTSRINIKKRKKNVLFDEKINKLLKFKNAKTAIKQMGINSFYTNVRCRDNSYTCKLRLNNVIYTAHSDNRENAQIAAAEKALDAIIVNRIQKIRGKKPTGNMDVYSFKKGSARYRWRIALPYIFTRCAEFIKNEPPPVANAEVEPEQVEDQKNPVQTINQAFPGIVLVECIEGPINNLTLGCIAEFDNRTFYSNAQNLKLAKRMVCQQILDYARAEGFDL